MDFNYTDGAIPASPAVEDAGATVASEIDLYEELKAFVDLSPEEQKRLVELPDTAAAETPAQSFPAEPGVTRPPMLEALEAAPESVTVESVSVKQDPQEYIDVRRRPFEILNPGGSLTAMNHSGPLSAMNPPLIFTGALTKGVCLACGAEAGVDDLFCIACGAFIDEVASSQPTNPNCVECNMRIVAGEIFCPGCGSVLRA